MNPILAAMLAALSSAISPTINYVEQKLESVGAALASGVTTILLNFTSDQRVIFANMTAFWQAKVAEATKAGSSELDALESATTATLNEFCAEEGAEFNDEKTAFVTLLKGAAKQAIAVVA